jgi:hypothetical protein
MCSTLFKLFSPPGVLQRCIALPAEQGTDLETLCLTDLAPDALQRRIICPQSEAEIRELIHIAAGAAKTSSRSASGGASRSGASAQAATPGQKQHTGAAPPGEVSAPRACVAA